MECVNTIGAFECVCQVKTETLQLKLLSEVPFVLSLGRVHRPGLYQHRRM